MIMDRYEVERTEGWDEIARRVPFVSVKAEWKIAVIPPFGGAAARFRVTLPTGVQKSVYLDCQDALGCVGEPYWEVYPVGGDCGRCLIDDVDELVRLIEADPDETDQAERAGQ